MSAKKEIKFSFSITQKMISLWKHTHICNTDRTQVQQNQVSQVLIFFCILTGKNSLGNVPANNIVWYIWKQSFPLHKGTWQVPHLKCVIMFQPDAVFTLLWRQRTQRACLPELILARIWGWSSEGEHKPWLMLSLCKSKPIFCLSISERKKIDSLTYFLSEEFETK